MKTYAQTKDKPKINWVKELSAGEISEEKYRELRTLDDWDSCPVGQLSVVIPRTDKGEPWDETLRTLGSKFSHNLEFKRYAIALVLAEAINKLGKIYVKEEEANLIKKVEKFYENSGLKKPK